MTALSKLWFSGDPKLIVFINTMFMNIVFINILFYLCVYFFIENLFKIVHTSM